MARFFGEVGYVHTFQEPPDSGIWVGKATEHRYRGDIVRAARSLKDGQGLNNDVQVTNSISVVADQYAIEHYAFIRYVRWGGVCWTVSTVEVQHPRLILSLGSVYNGPTP